MDEIHPCKFAYPQAQACCDTTCYTIKLHRQYLGREYAFANVQSLHTHLIIACDFVPTMVVLES